MRDICTYVSEMCSIFEKNSVNPVITHPRIDTVCMCKSKCIPLLTDLMAFKLNYKLELYRLVILRGNPTNLKQGEVLTVFCNFEEK